MSSSFSDFPDSLLPETFVIPDEPEELKIKLYQYLNDIAIASNSKTNGSYYDEEVLTGQKLFPAYDASGNANTRFRDIYRKVIDTGALPNATFKNVPHGIPFDSNYAVIKFYGAAYNSTLLAAIPLPNVNILVPTDVVQLSLNSTVVSLSTSTASYATVDRSYVVVEYVKLL